MGLWLLRLGAPALLSGVLTLASCAGSINESDEAPAPGPMPIAGVTPLGPAPMIMPVAVVPPAAATPTGPQPIARLRRITGREFSNSLRDLLGATVWPADLEVDQSIEGLLAVGASVVAVSPSGVSRYEAAVSGAIERSLPDAARAAKLVACVPQTPADDACATKAINAFGRRAFRRPLVPAETSRYLGIAQAIGQEAGSSALIGLRYALMAILQSPNFLYRVELGTPSPADGDRRKFSSFEMASRLASLLGGTVPDDALLDVAAQDGLANPDGVRKQGERLLAHANSRRAVSAFMDDLYGADHLQNAFKDPVLFKAWTPGLREAMQADLKGRVDELVFGMPGDFLSLYDSRVVFVNNELGKVYGVPAVMPDALRRAELPETSPRRGLITSGAILAAFALPQRTSPTQRGRFMAESLLCKTVPDPPPGVETNLDPMANDKGTVREQLDRHRMNPACAGCHALMDPMGLGLENFDSIAAYRPTEKGKVIDASGDVDGLKFKDAAELGQRLRQHPNAGPCFVSKLYSHAQGRLPVGVDDPALATLSKQFAASGNRADRLLMNLVASDAFRFVELAKP